MAIDGPHACRFAVTEKAAHGHAVEFAAADFASPPQPRDVSLHACCFPTMQGNQGNSMLTPGFAIKNETIWPLQISLSQVGPLYFDVIQPGQSFVRDTGAVWFTLKAAIFLDEKDRITNWDAVKPVLFVVGAAILALSTAGAAGFASGPAAAAMLAADVVSAGLVDLASGSVLPAVTAAATLAGAGFSRTAVMVVDGHVIDRRRELTPAAQAALENVFSIGNISLTSGGCYAGPPWPFRRELTPLRITGGPTFRRVPGKDQVELVAGRLQIDSPPPPAAYGVFSLQTGTALVAGDGNYRFVLASNRDLVAIKTGNTGSGGTEIHILSADSGYRQFSVQTATALGPVDRNWEFGIAPNRDVFAIHKNNTGSGTTEVHVLSAAHGYKTFALQSRTALAPTDGSWAFAIAHNRDLVAIKKSATGTGMTEVHILAASANYQVFAIQTGTALHMTDDRWTFDIARNGDIFAFMKNGAGSGTCELHILAAQANYRQFAIQTKTALHEIDDTWSLRVSGDRDVFAIRKAGGTSNSTEVHVMKG